LVPARRVHRSSHDAARPRDRRSHGARPCATLAGLGAAALALASWPAAEGRPLTDADRRAIDRRLEPSAKPEDQLTVEEGGTLFLERALAVPPNRIVGKADDYEALVLGVVSPKGVVVHPRADAFRLEPSGPGYRLWFRYVIHVEPGARVGGKLKLSLTLLERKGLGNTVFQKPVEHTLAIGEPRPRPEDLAADFFGFRLYRSLAAQKLGALQRAGLRTLSMDEQVPLPSMDQLDARRVGQLLEFDRLRRRAGIAYRHLVAAKRARDPEVASLAKTYLGAVDRPDLELADLPPVALELVPSDLDEPAAPERPAPPQVAPEAPRERAATDRGTEKEPSKDSSLAPVGAYEPGSDSDEPEPPRPEPEPEPEPPPPPATVVEASPEPAPLGPDEEEDTVEDPFQGRVRRRIPIVPGYFRPLVLDDPNIGHGAGARFAYARVRSRESALASALFYFGQVALTRSLGLELTLPTQLVDLDVERVRSLYAIGNPLVAAKYRLNLPELRGRRPALTLRARWGIPIAAQHRIPPTELGAEDFTREAHFSDTYAFFLEKTSLGGGASLSWSRGIFSLAMQLNADYFSPVKGALDQTSFLTLGYGASVGALPFGDLVGFFAEARATSLFSGPGRTELFAYAGARARLPLGFEPALWVALPLGSVAEVSGAQLGVELRFAFDRPERLELRAQRRDELLP
jgi:hypothetical protein